MQKEDNQKIKELEEFYKNSKTEERRKHKTPEELELEYSNLKAIFAILETNDFKYSDFECISYRNHDEDREIELFSERHGIHKIVTYADFIRKFRISPYGFVDFMKTNGAINEKSPDKHTRLRAKTPASEALAPKGPTAGEYFLDPATGFWRVATNEDVEYYEKKRKEALYAKFDDIFFSEMDGDLPE